MKSRVAGSSKYSSIVYSDIHKVVLAGSFDGILSMFSVSKEGVLAEVYKSNPAEWNYGISQLLLSQDNKMLFASLYSSSILVFSVSKQQCKLIG